MDSWRQSMGTEGCSSSESGWTMYIASPMEEDDCSNIENEANEDGLYGDNNNNNNRRKRLVNKRDEEDSDDSMASDASSGPTHHNGSASANKKDKKDHAVAGKSCSSSRNIASKHDKKRLESRSK